MSESINIIFYLLSRVYEIIEEKIKILSFIQVQMYIIIDIFVACVKNVIKTSVKLKPVLTQFKCNKITSNIMKFSELFSTVTL